jgi:hypothetical protein
MKTEKLTMREKLPIFVIVRDRLTVLMQSLISYQEQIDYPIEIVFIDNNSKYQPTIDFLKDHQNRGISVYWNKSKSCETRQFSQEWPGIIKKHLESMAEIPGYYLLTDSDIALDKVDSDIIDVFIFLMNKTNVGCVGTSLRIDDIPDYYPACLKKFMLKRHREFWDSNNIKQIDYNGKTVKYIKAPIATTFALYRANLDDKMVGFQHITKNAIRTFKPYSARHLDWYINPENLKEDQKFYLNNLITHWSGVDFKKAILEGA